MGNGKYFGQYCPNPTTCLASMLTKDSITFSACKD